VPIGETYSIAAQLWQRILGLTIQDRAIERIAHFDRVSALGTSNSIIFVPKAHFYDLPTSLAEVRMAVQI
jgi:hypothetical protein